MFHAGAFHGLIDAREINFEASALSDFAVDPDEAAALLDHAVDGGEAQAGAFPLFLGSKKRFEDARLSFLIHAHSGVADGEEHVGSGCDDRTQVAVVAIELGVRSLDQQAAAVGHGVARVDREIHDDLFDLAGIGANGAKIWREAEDELDIFANEAGNELDDILDDGVEIEDARLEDLHAAESEKLASQGGGAVGGAVDLFDFARGGVRRRQDIHQQLGVALDDHEEIVEVVGDAAREAAHGLHFLGLAELFFELMAFADVLRDDEMDGVSVVIELMGDEFGVDSVAIFRHVLAEHFVARLGFELAEAFEEVAVVGRVANVGDVHGFEFFARVAVLVDGSVVDLEEAKVCGIENPGGKRIVSEEQAEHGLALGEGVFRAAALDGEGDVAADGVEEFEITLIVGVFSCVMLDHEDADGGSGRFQRHAKPRRRGRTDELDFTEGGQAVKFGLRDEHGVAGAKDERGAATIELLWRRRGVELISEEREVESVSVGIVEGDLVLGPTHYV